MRVRYSDQVVHYLQREPSTQPGFSVTQDPAKCSWGFEGRLNTEFTFAAVRGMHL